MAKQYHVLVVDDGEINQILLCKILEKQGISSDVAFDGEEAIQKAAEHAYDLIFMDIQMPGVDGYQAAEVIRGMEKEKTTPIIAVTANATPEDEEKCLGAGMDDYISKPVHARQIIRIIETLFENHKLNSSRAETDQENSPSQVLFDKIHQDIPFMAHMLDQFELSYEHFISDVNIALAEDNLQEVSRQAHALKGLAGAIEAKGAMMVLDKVEQQVGALQADSVLILLKQLKVEVQSSLTAHKEFILEQSSPK